MDVYLNLFLEGFVQKFESTVLLPYADPADPMEKDWMLFIW